MVAKKIGADRTFQEELVSLGDEMAEISLLVPRWQASALEDAARNQGQTPAQLLRMLIDRSFRWQGPRDRG